MLRYYEHGGWRVSYADGWFKVSRRIFRSSRWYKGSPESIKVLVFLIGQAQDPLNPTPGIVQMGETAIAHQTGLSTEATKAALDWLCSPDSESRTRTDEGCTVRRLEDGSGFELVNYEPYHPGEAQAAEARREKARKAANARWERAGREGAGGVEGHAATGAALDTAVPLVPSGQEIRELAGQGDGLSPRGTTPAAGIKPGPAPSLPTNGSAREEYARIIGEKALEITGNLQLSSVEFGQILTWREEGIPLRVVLSAIEEGLRPSPGAAPREPRSLRYFDPIVREEWERVKKARTV